MLYKYTALMHFEITDWEEINKLKSDLFLVICFLRRFLDISL